MKLSVGWRFESALRTSPIFCHLNIQIFRFLILFGLSYNISYYSSRVNELGMAFCIEPSL